MRANPAPNTTVRASPDVVRICFKIAGTEGLDRRHSIISVCDASGGRVDEGRGGVDPDDPKRRSLLARLRPLGPGVYTVTWRAVSSEHGDVATGTFQFTVAPWVVTPRRRHRVITPALFLLCVLLWWAGAEQRAAAHAVLERSSPPANATLENPPGRVDLWFSEEIDRAFSSARVLDSRGQAVAGPGSVSSDGRQITLPLPSLPQGLYTVTWRVLSAVDGHATSGVVLFGVGTSVADARAAGAESGVDPGLVLIRWVGYLAAFLLAGVEFFHIGVLRPGLHRLAPQNRVPLMSAAVPALRDVTMRAGVVFLAVLAAEVARLTMRLADASLLEVIRSGTLWRLLWGTNPGWSALVRAGAAVLLLLPPTPRGRMLRAAGLIWGILAGTLLAVLGPGAIEDHVPILFLTALVYGLISIGVVLLWPYLSDSRQVSLTWAPPAVAAVLLAGFTVSTHAWGTGPLAVAVDWLHLIALATWIGGLASLLVVVRAAQAGDRPPLLRVLVPRFSSVAAIGLAVVVGTGLYSARLNVPNLQALRTTLYGRTLLIKLAFVASLVALGAVNRFVIRPRLEDREKIARPGLQRRFQGLVGGEVGLAAAIVLVVAVLTALPPARITAPAAATATLQPLRLAATSGDVAVTFTIDPPFPGPIRLAATATALAGRPLPPESRVLARVMKLDEDLTPATIALTPRGEGRYEAVTGELALPGMWEIEVIVRRPGQPDAEIRFPARLGTPPLRPVDSASGQVLAEATQAMTALKTWRQTEQITDGVGGVSVLHFEIVRPDRLHYRAAGSEGIVIGSEQFQRTSPGSPWTRTILPQPFGASSIELYLEGAGRSARLGRSGPCDEEVCQVVLWDSSGGAHLAAWVGRSSKLVYRLLMVAPSHYMTLEFSDFNTPLRIEAPR